MTSDRSELLDRAGLAVSIVCAVHCLAIPLTMAALVAYGASGLASPPFEWAVLLLSCIVGVASLLPSYRKRHGRKRCLFLLVMGIAVIGAAHVLLENAPHAEAAAVSAGAASICSAHLINRVLCKRCRACN